MEISKYQEHFKNLLNYSLVPSLTLKRKFFSIIAKNRGKIEIELFP